jgi:hypothetical protein
MCQFKFMMIVCKKKPRRLWKGTKLLTWSVSSLFSVKNIMFSLEEAWVASNENVQMDKKIIKIKK